MTWSLPQLLASLHDGIEQRLTTARKTIGHPGSKGDASQAVWLELFQTYLPKRYQAEAAHVVDSDGAFSDQIDAVIFDRQYFALHFSIRGPRDRRRRKRVRRFRGKAADQRRAGEIRPG